jgi:hypothetical protein
MARCKEPTCNKEFAPKKKDQLFCSDKCRKLWYDKNYFGKVSETMVCPVCHREFETTKSGQQIYCNDPPGNCRKIAQERLTFGLRVDEPLAGPGTCEICGKDYKQRGTHHHITVCLDCYIMASRVDNGMVAKYMELLTARVTEEDLWGG